MNRDDDRQLDEDFAAFDELEEGEEEVDVPEIEETPPPPPVGKKKAAPPKEPEPKKSSQEEEKKDRDWVEALELAPDVPVQVVAVMAKKNISMRELMQFHAGQVIDLNRPPSEQVDVVANGKLIARGELVEIDGKLGVRIVKLVR